MENKLYNKLFLSRIWKRIYFERLCEPFLYNIVSLFVLLFGSYRKKIDYDLIPRHPYAFGINLVCQTVERLKRKFNAAPKKVVLIEFGVAGGGGFLNMIDIANHLTEETGIEFIIAGFDTGKGMPQSIDFRDHPEMYSEGDFPVYNREALIAELPANAKIYFGDVQDTIPEFFRELPEDCKIGFISVDLDYYSSTKKSLEILKQNADYYLPSVAMYFDDVQAIGHNEYCGELLAIKEFNKEDNRYRKIAKMDQLKDWRLFKHALWLDQMYFAHVFDSKYRSRGNREVFVLDNPYINKN